jgi:RsiW-degrading membrane proteinase PrsW (M82 family)
MSIKESIEVYSHYPGFSELLFFLASGFILSVPMTVFFETTAVNYLQGFTSTKIARFVLIVLLAPIIEEYSKIFPMFYRHEETEKSLIGLSFLIGLGFGIAEFFSYVFGLGVPFYIRLPVIFFHASSTAITAYDVTKAQTLRYYSLATFLHLINNLFAILGSFCVIASIGLILLS